MHSFVPAGIFLFPLGSVFRLQQDSTSRCLALCTAVCTHPHPHLLTHLSIGLLFLFLKLNPSKHAVYWMCSQL